MLARRHDPPDADARRLEPLRRGADDEEIGRVFDPYDGDEKHVLRAPTSGLLSGVRRQPLLFQGDLVARLQLVGSESPPSSRGVARLLTRALPRVETVELEGLGHMGPVTHPEVVNATIARFLDGL